MVRIDSEHGQADFFAFDAGHSAMQRRSVGSSIASSDTQAANGQSACASSRADPFRTGSYHLNTCFAAFRPAHANHGLRNVPKPYEHGRRALL